MGIHLSFGVPREWQCGPEEELEDVVCVIICAVVH
jgi:hypothetical protein